MHIEGGLDFHVYVGWAYLLGRKRVGGHGFPLHRMVSCDLFLILVLLTISLLIVFSLVCACLISLVLYTSNGFIKVLDVFSSIDYDNVFL